MKVVGDIGGTNARFAIIEGSGAGGPTRERTFRCADFPDLASALEAYLDGAAIGNVREAAVAVASPIVGDLVRFTNNPWQFSIADTQSRLGLERLVVINDFTALALALPLLGDRDVRQVGRGQPAEGKPLALIGAGTGLGVSGLIPVGTGWVPIEGEGGHTAFSPANTREAEVLAYLWRRYDHVSTERLASGPGLSTLHEALCGLDGIEGEPVMAPEQVTARADAGDSRAEEAVEMFCGILATAAANLCVTLGARGGVYVGGGIVPGLGERFDRSCFRERFESKGRYRDYVAAVPTYVITANNPALRGAARAFER